MHFAQANWRKVQDLGLKEVYGQQMKVRTLIKSCVSLALIPPEVLIMGFDQVCSASASFPEVKCYLKYFEETWLGSPGRLGKRSKPLFSINLWSQFENARNGNQETNNVEGWHRAFQLGMGFAHPTITKFLQYPRIELSFTENRIARIRAEILPVNAKVLFSQSIVIVVFPAIFSICLVK